MANHNGRRAIGADSPVARQRDCRIEVDGKAAVRWFTGYSPDGSDGDLVGVTAQHGAEPPVIRRNVTVHGDGGSYLAWFLAEYDIGDWKEALREEHCGHIKEGTEELAECLANLDYVYVNYHYAMLWRNTPLTRCATELALDARGNMEANGSDNYYADTENKLLLLERALARKTYRLEVYASMYDAVYVVVSHPDLRAAYRERSSEEWFDGPNDLFAKHRECRDLFEDELADLDG